MRKVVYEPARDRLVYLLEKATPEFWDALWEREGEAVDIDPLYLDTTRRHLPVGSRVLEGGCGRADKVKSLTDAGYKAVGLDFAERTVERARRVYPGLDVRTGDVRALQFDEASFDGYWSIGVIEHFWDGYEQILAEAARVIRPGGILFLTAPWFSPMRRRKARAGGFPQADFKAETTDFYQFALGREEVSRRLEAAGFDVERWEGKSCEISLREDLPQFKGPVEWLFGSRGSLPKRVLRQATMRMLDPFCGHSFLCIARRRSAK